MNMIKKTLLLAATALGLSACTTMDNGMATTASAMGNPAPAGQVDPAVWRVADEDTTIYMLGTFHLLPENYQWRTDTIEAAIAASDEVYFEVADDLRDPTSIMPIVQELAVNPQNPSLVERVGAEDAARIAELTAPMGMPMQALDVMDTWFIGLTLANVLAMEAGATPEAGVEIDLREQVEARGLPIKGLETAREQLTHLDTMPQDAQVEFLRAGLEDTTEEMTAMFTGMMDAWVRGDEDAISEYFNDGMEVGTPQRISMLTNRNTDWTGDIVARMDQPGTVLVAVGAGHLVGSDSVVAMLRERGYTVERIDD